MTNQEKIEKGLFKIISKTIRASKESGRRNTGIHTLIEGAVREALLYLSANNAVLRVDRELPKFDKTTMAEANAMNILIGAGYVAVEPLVKE